MAEVSVSKSIFCMKGEISMNFTRMLVPILLAFCFGVLPITAQAITFSVNSTVDDVDATPGDGLCATTDGECTLRAAIQEANALAGLDIVKLKSGLHVLAIEGGSENAGATGDLDITDDLVIIGAGAKKTFINGRKLDRVFHIIGSISVTMTDITIQNGLATDDGYGDVNNVNGGGILNESASTLTLKGVTLSNNSASGGVNGSGGGIYNSGTLTITVSTLTLAKSTITNNAVIGGSEGVVGGAIYNAGTANIKSTTISDNIVSGPKLGFGGAIFNPNTGILEIRGSTISNNTVAANGQYAEGGAISCNGIVTITRSTISNNKAQGGLHGDGGGIANGGTLTITTSIISRNLAWGAFAAGGGIASFIGYVVITGSNLSYNAASAVSGNPGLGGGIFWGANTDIKVQGASKILWNFSSDAGGGICYGGAVMGSISADSTVAKNIPDNIYPTP
jgi:CSLREA domain-containing protein